MAGRSGNPLGVCDRGCGKSRHPPVGGSTLAVDGFRKLRRNHDQSSVRRSCDGRTSEFPAGIQQAATILAGTISDKITVNLIIDYSGTGGGAAAGPDHGLYEPYSLIRSDLINGARRATQLSTGCRAEVRFRDSQASRSGTHS